MTYEQFRDIVERLIINASLSVYASESGDEDERKRHVQKVDDCRRELLEFAATREVTSSKYMAIDRDRLKSISVSMIKDKYSPMSDEEFKSHLIRKLGQGIAEKLVEYEKFESREIDGDTYICTGFYIVVPRGDGELS